MSDPSRYNFTLYRGATFARTFFLKNPDGTPVDLTGYTAEFSAKGSLQATTEVFNLTESPSLVIDAAAGSITLTITDEETAALQLDHMVYTLKIIVGGAVYPQLFGQIIVSSEVF